MEKGINLKIDYDERGDILYIFQGEPFSTMNFELDQNYTLRFDPKTKVIVGIIIHQYSKCYPAAQRTEDQRKTGETIFKLINQLYREQKLKEPLLT